MYHEEESFRLTFRTRFAPRRNPCADTARLSAETPRCQHPFRFNAQPTQTGTQCRVHFHSLGRNTAQLRTLTMTPATATEDRDPPVLSCNWSSLSPRSATFVIFSLMIPTVSSICCWIAAVLALPCEGPGVAPPPFRGRYGSYGSDLRCAETQNIEGQRFHARRVRRRNRT